MKKVLEGELLSLAHRVLQMKEKDVSNLLIEAKELYEKLLIMKFYQDHLVGGQIKDVTNEQLENALTAVSLGEQVVVGNIDRHQMPNDLVEEDYPIVVDNEVEATVMGEDSFIADIVNKIAPEIEEKEFLISEEMNYNKPFLTDAIHEDFTNEEEDAELNRFLDEHEAMLRETESKTLEAARIAEEEARRIEAEELEVARIAEEEARRIEAEELEAARIAEEEARRIEAEELEAARIAEEEARRIEAEELEAARIAEEEARRIEAELQAKEEARLEAIEAERLRLEAEVAEQAEQARLSDEQAKEIKLKQEEEDYLEFLIQEEEREKEELLQRALEVKEEQLKQEDNNLNSKEEQVDRTTSFFFSKEIVEAQKQKEQPKNELDPFFGFDFGDVEFVRVEDVVAEEKIDVEATSNLQEENTVEYKNNEESSNSVEQVTPNTLFDVEHMSVKEPKIVKPKSINDIYNTTITVGLNDRIAFEKHLFGNSAEDFNRVLSQLNTVSTFDEAMSLIEHLVKPEYNNWEGKDEYEERFIALVEKRFI
ncbi:hypothetical protein VSP20_01535 [Myroides phaeus]|uniref:hypothetical protein n=1 Tax=Myroides phaeus TaxID=702745 RepID=UPI002DB676C8|nr:hypothetical protein [Myroides phaeus]MEC4115639.1 hypothetical protein [Myroides phaeus]